MLLVEGSKDAYFLHELIVKRMGDVFEGDPRVTSETKVPKMPFELCSKSGDKKIVIHWTDGYQKIKDLRQILMRPADMENEDQFVSGIIFDADSSSAKNALESHAGQLARRDEILRLLNLDASLNNASRAWLFLFPDNMSDGDLETILRYVVKDTANHTRFFDKAWTPFVDNVVSIPDANRPTNKSMMNEYKAAFNAEAWDTNGLNRCYTDDSLWDWSAKELDPLIDFLTGLINGDSASNLGNLLK